jgi:hypothetical protein
MTKELRPVVFQAAGPLTLQEIVAVWVPGITLPKVSAQS